MNELNMAELVTEFLKTRLRLDVRTEDVYVGDMCDSGSLYRQSTEVLLMLDNEVISGVWIN